MTNVATTLGQLKASLTAKERALLTIRAELADETPDSHLRRSMPDGQREEFRRYMVLYYVANAELGTIAIFSQREANNIAHLGEIGQILDRAKAEASADLNEQVERLKGRRAGEKVNLPTYLDGLAASCRRVYLEEASHRWQELRAIEILWDEICGEFGGEDVVRLELRQKLLQARECLGTVFEDCHRKRRPEPPMELVESYRQHVRDVIRMFGLEHLE